MNYCAFRVINQSTQMLAEYQSIIHNYQWGFRGYQRVQNSVFLNDLSYYGVRFDHLSHLSFQVPKIEAKQKSCLTLSSNVDGWEEKNSKKMAKRLFSALNRRSKLHSKKQSINTDEGQMSQQNQKICIVSLHYLHPQRE